MLADDCTEEMTNLTTMKSPTICAECKRLRDAYDNATLKYVRFHNGTHQDENEAQRLYDRMTDSRNALFAHQQQHAVRN